MITTASGPCNKKISGNIDSTNRPGWHHDAVIYQTHVEAFRAFYFPVMARMYISLSQEDRAPIVDIMARIPPIPSSCQWASFLRNHDELTLKMVTEDERVLTYEPYWFRLMPPGGPQRLESVSDVGA